MRTPNLIFGFVSLDAFIYTHWNHKDKAYTWRISINCVGFGPPPNKKKRKVAGRGNRKEKKKEKTV